MGIFAGRLSRSAGYWSSSIVLKQDHQFIVRGPYRYVRHPIYCGVVLMVLGTVVIPFVL